MQRLSQPRAAIAGLALDRPRLMGVVNVTPDSFSDGGRYAHHGCRRRARAAARGGGRRHPRHRRGVRPGPASDPVELEEECRRVLPVIAALAKRSRARLSVDTRKAEVMRRAALEGAHIINDVSALTHDPRSLEVAATLGLPVILMHARGDPAHHAGQADLRRRGARRVRRAGSMGGGLRAGGHSARAAGGRPRHRLRQEPGAQPGAAGLARRFARPRLRGDAGRLAQELHRPAHRGGARAIACRARSPRRFLAPRRACSCCACTTSPRRARRWPCGKARLR